MVVVYQEIEFWPPELKVIPCFIIWVCRRDKKEELHANKIFMRINPRDQIRFVVIAPGVITAGVGI
jgi:hypothetical protein